MNAEQLKASLLQQAIEGKLVPQLDEEPPVEQIGEAPKDVPFAIPEKWKWCLMKDITRKIHYGFTASAMESGNARLLRITDIQDGDVNWDAVPFCNVPDSKLKSYVLNKDDIVIARTGGTIGKSFLLSEVNDVSVFASYLIRLIPCIDFVYPQYLISFLNSMEYWSQLRDVSQGTGQPNVNAKSLGMLRIPVPPLVEQRRIVEKLNALLPLVEEYGKAYDRLTRINKEFPSQLKASLLQQAIEGKLVPQLDEEPPVAQIGEPPKDVSFAIPEKWKWVKMNNFVEVIQGTSYKSGDVSTSGIRVIRGGNLNDSFRITFKDDDVFLPESFANKKQVVSEHDIVVVASTGSLDVIGRPASVSISDRNKCQIGAFLRIVRPKNVSMSDYLKVIFKSALYRDGIKGLVKGTNIRNIKKEYILDMYIPVPPIEEQRRIVEKLNALLPLVDEMSA